jgi:hypothetical protein
MSFDKTPFKKSSISSMLHISESENTKKNLRLPLKNDPGYPIAFSI